MDSQGDLVQIVIPCFNGAEFLEETLYSIQNQSYRNFDCLMIDDGSTDNTSRIFDDFAQHDSRFRVLKNLENQGESFSVNRGWQNRRGDLITFVSCDDPQPSDWLNEMISFYKFHAHGDYIVYYPNRIVIDQHGDLLRKETLFDWSDSLLFIDLLCVPSVGAIINCSLLPKNFEPRIVGVKYPSDLVQYLKIAEIGSGLRHPTYYSVWREHENGKSAEDVLNLTKDFLVGMKIYMESQQSGSKIVEESIVFAHAVGKLRKKYSLLKSLVIGFQLYLEKFSIQSLKPFMLVIIFIRFISRHKAGRFTSLPKN